jgi:hypothetical protein
MSTETPPQEPATPIIEEPPPPRVKGSRVPIYLAIIIIVVVAGAAVWFLRFNTRTPVLIFYPSQQLVSADWAGYSVSSDLTTPLEEVTAVSGSWIVPTVSGGVESFSASWVGIGGQYDESLIQTGTEQSIINGSPSYFAWYELLPSDAVYLNMTVNAGDSITATLKLQNSATDTWQVDIRNLSNGQSFQKTVNYASTRSSAEWIVERPTVSNVQYPLVDFGSVTFSACSATIGSRTASISGFPHSLLYLKGRMSNDLVSLSSLSSDGTSFTINFLASR